MSYISAITKNNDVIVWIRNDLGEREMMFHRAPWEFYVADRTGPNVSIFGDKVRKIQCANREEFTKLKQDFASEKIPTFETDIAPEYKILSKHYYGKESPKLNMSFYDIEVDYDPDVGFPSVKNPYAPVSAVSLYHQWSDKSMVIVVPPPNFDLQQFDESLRELSEVIICKNERELLNVFLDNITDSDTISGWNSTFFDTPYVCKRIEKILGKTQVSRMCFPGAGDPRWRIRVFKGIGEVEIVELQGRVHLDYMELFKKYEMDQRRLYTLEAIAEEILPHLPKLKYKGTLAELYRNDFNFFVKYNIRDTEILKGFEEKLGYVQLANVMVHTSAAQFRNVLGTVQLVDMAIYNYCKHELNVVVPDQTTRDLEYGSNQDSNQDSNGYSDVDDADDDEDDDDRESFNKSSGINTGGDYIKKGIDGAYVLLPRVGMHEWIGSIDINSLYPSAIRSINISPETLVGQFAERAKAWNAIVNDSPVELTLVFNDGTEEIKTAQEWKDWCKANKWAVSGYGTVFNQTKQGIIPAILASWYKQRKDYQKLKVEYDDKSKQAAKDGNQEKSEQFGDLAKYYDRLQYVYKIKLNSTYGALTNQFFRYFDLRMGESVTATGRMVLKHQIKKVAEILDGDYNVDFPLYDTVKEAAKRHADPSTALDGPKFKGNFQTESILYGDTDSCYFLTHTDNKDKAIKVANRVAEKVNKSFQHYMQEAFLCTDGFDNIIKAGREIVSDRGIFVQKKRYFLHIVDLDGKAPKPGKELKVMGLDTKKTILPKPIAQKINTFIERLLLGEDWNAISKSVVEFKDEIKQMDVVEIGLPKGVKNVEQYTEAFTRDYNTRLPGHVAASIFYNQSLLEYNDKESPAIISGSKIKIYYLKGKFGRFKSIAIPAYLEEAPKWFVEHFKIDYKAQIERLVDNPLENIIKAIGKKAPSKDSLLVDEFFEF